MRLIDADALVWKIKTEKGGTPAMLVAVNSIPTVDAVPVKNGHWIRINGERAFVRFTMKCSECGAVGRMNGKLFLYCPNCGAKMDGERREDDN